MLWSNCVLLWPITRHNTFLQDGAGKSGKHIFYINNLLNCAFICINTWVKVYCKQRLNIHCNFVTPFMMCSTNMFTSDTHTRLTALFPGLPRWAGTRKVKPIWILLKQETVSGSSISWAICKSATRSSQITIPAPQWLINCPKEGMSCYTCQQAYLTHVVFLLFRFDVSSRIALSLVVYVWELLPFSLFFPETAAQCSV